MRVKQLIRRTAPAGALLAWRRLKSRALIAATARRPCLAEIGLDVRRLPAFRAEYFPESGPSPWLDRDDAEDRIAARLHEGSLDADEAGLCRRWHREGYLHLSAFHDPARIDETWQAVERAVAAGEIPVLLEAMTEGGPWEGRFQDLHQRVPQLRAILEDERTLKLVALLLGSEPRPFQTIVFFAGSQQKAHSDHIHMSTYPRGFLVGTWTAMEDIHPDSGPLIYYPRSHRLPYATALGVGITLRESLLGFYEAYDEKYEPYVEQAIQRAALEPRVHTPSKGDLLLWHAKLLHGGMPRNDLRRSRKSVVCHYVARDAICYHDISASLARLE